MIRLDPKAFYYVYPSWADYRFKWGELSRIFTNPFGSGFLANESSWRRIKYQLGERAFELIAGPVGNGIIKGIGDRRTDKFLWQAVLLQETDFTRLPGFHYLAPEYGACWLEEKGSADLAMGLKVRAATFLPSISMDYDDCPDSVVYVSMAFGTRTQDEELCLRAQMLWQGFGLKCQPASPLDSLPPVARNLVSPVISHRWFILERGTDDAGLLAAKAFYLGCAAKYVSRSFKFIHLIGAFEGKPKMAQLWTKYANK